MRFVRNSPSPWHTAVAANVEFSAPAAQSIDDPFARAAARTRQSVQPEGGRLEGPATFVLENYLPHVANQLLTLPQRALEASERLRLTGEYDPGPAVETALMMAGMRGMRAGPPGRGMARRGSDLTGGTVNPVASRNASLYNPPVKPQRPFELDYPPADYPHGVPADAAGRLTADIEGRRRAAERVVGRRTLGGADEALTPAQIDAVATTITGNNPEAVAGRQIGGNAGLFRVSRDREGNPIYSIEVNRALSPAAKDRVVAHELGHTIDYFAAPRRGIPQEGIRTELSRNYNTGVTGQERERNLTLPQHQDYKADEVPSELMAEAIRAYIANPNYFKTVAPETAARIREWWNSHPKYSKYLQFNSVAGTAGAGLVAGDATPPSNQDAFWDAWRRGDAL
jgi:hypothetical protein